MTNLFKTIRDRFSAERRNGAKKVFTAGFGVYHDDVLVGRFEIKVGAYGKDHARRILKNYVEVRIIDLK